MQISMTSDYCGGTGDFHRPLRMIGEAGFTHIMWCHQWNTDFIYTSCEIDEIKKAMRDYGIALLDIHGSAGVEKSWFSEIEYRRRAGVDMVRNRIEMMDALEGTGTVVMHSPALRFRNYFASDEEMEAATKLNTLRYDSMRRSIDELLPVLEKYQVKLAIENTITETWEMLNRTFAAYPAHLVGLCYDSGHCNIKYDGTGEFAACADRLICTHLHDNDGLGDLHQPPFYGTIDWEKVTSIIAGAKDLGIINFEIVMKNTPHFNAELAVSEQSDDSHRAFLAECYEKCSKIVNMVETKRAARKKF